jgi:hypothetical protein
MFSSVIEEGAIVSCSVNSSIALSAGVKSAIRQSF